MADRAERKLEAVPAEVLRKPAMELVEVRRQAEVVPAEAERTQATERPAPIAARLVSLPEQAMAREGELARDLEAATRVRAADS